MRIYLIGDSISLHYGPFLQQYVEGMMEYSRFRGDEPAFRGLELSETANGGDSGRVRAIVEAIAASPSLDPLPGTDCFLINCGLHDIKTDPATGKKQVVLERYIKNLEVITHTIVSLERKMAWLRTTPVVDQLHNTEGMAFHRHEADCAKYNSAADKVMQRHGVPRIDLHAFTRNLGEGIYCDHVHYTDPVRQQQAAFIAGWLMASRNSLH